MSSSEFQKVLVRDERLDCHPSIPFAVYKSGQNVTVATFSAISQSAASHTYNIQVPSETTIIDRRVIWKSTITFKASVTLPGGGGALTGPVFLFGSNCGFSPYPLHTICTTQQITINNNTVSINMNDVLPAIVKLGTDMDTNRYNGLALTQGDFFSSQQASVGYPFDPLADINSSALDRAYKGRGSMANVRFSNPTLGGVPITVAGGGSLFTWTAATAAPASATPAAAGAGTIYTVDITADFWEPLICSPFIYTNPYYNGQGFYGIQNLNFVFNINADANSGFFRTAFSTAAGQPPNAATISNVSFANSDLIFNFLSPKPSDMLTARNVVPYWEMPRFTTNNFVGPAGAVTNANGVIIPSLGTIQSQSIQLNQIPDKIIIFVRPSRSNRVTGQADVVLPITNISVNFNNMSGILASATPDQLWRYSVESGSNQTWDEFRGVANVANATTGYPCNDVPMLGSYLMLEFGRHIQITEDYYASGSLGNFNLQFSINVANYSGTSYAAQGSLELVLITQNSGIFVCEKGQSATYTGVLTKDDVLSASSSSSVNERALHRMVGGVDLGRMMRTGRALIEPARGLANSLLGEDSKLRKGINVVADINKAVGDGRAGSRIRGSGKGSARFALEDRLV